MTDDQLNTALQAEYLHIQKTIEDFDSRTLTIKAWSVTFGLVAIASAFASHSHIPFLISATSAAIFWMLEIQWKLFQTSYYARSDQIEAHFRGEMRVYHPFQIGKSWNSMWKKKRISEIPRVASWPHVALPHTVVLALGILLFILSVTQTIKP
jgi:hypothetical protein